MSPERIAWKLTYNNCILLHSELDATYMSPVYVVVLSGDGLLLSLTVIP